MIFLHNGKICLGLLPVCVFMIVCTCVVVAKSVCALLIAVEKRYTEGHRKRKREKYVYKFFVYVW